MPRFAAITEVALLLVLALDASAEDRPRIEADGTIHVPAFDLPLSDFLSEESRAAMKYFGEVYGPAFGSFSKGCPNLSELADDPEAIRAARQCVADGYYKTAIYKDTLAKHDVDISSTTMGGVYTEVFTPNRGIAPVNRKRVLISIHGGGFVVGARYFSHTESMQVADLGAIKVYSPDYRMAPEAAHPEGIEDIVAVYRELLKEYQPENIGIYGCSAGAMLAAQTVAYLQQNNLPPPGAVGLLCAALPTTEGKAGVFKNGESGYVVSALSGRARPVRQSGTRNPSPYFRGVKANDPVVAPGDHDDVLRKFPPTLLISGTRDFSLSSVIASHTKLTSLGVEAELHIWEGLGHATFAFNPRLPESDQVHKIMARFFDKHLGRRRAGNTD